MTYLVVLFYCRMHIRLTSRLIPSGYDFFMMRVNLTYNRRHDGSVSLA